MPSIFDKLPLEVRERLLRELMVDLRKSSPTGRLRREEPNFQYVPYQTARERSDAYRKVAEQVRTGQLRIPRVNDLDDLIGKRVHVQVEPLNAKTAVLIMERNADGVWEWRGRRVAKAGSVFFVDDPR
jgi:hypothetical protein